MSEKQPTAATSGLNRAKMYQLVLFPMNNGATNVYFVLVLSYVAQFGSSVLQLGMFASIMVTVMRVADAITDPIIGALMDRTSTRIGKFRPFMIIGSAIMAVSVIALYVLLPLIPDTMMPLRYIGFVVVYFIWVIGYTFQTSCTRAGQTVLTNDPNQRPMFTIFNTIGSMLGMGVMQLLIPMLKNMYNVYDDAGNLVTSGYARPELYRIIAPVGIAVSVFLTILAIIGIAGKDRPEYYGIGGGKQEKVKMSEYWEIIKNNKPMQRLMVAGAGCKLALAIATNTTVLLALYGIMMGNYDSLYLPMMILGYVCAVPFFLLSVRTSQKKGQKASLTRYVSVAFVCYLVVLVLLIVCDHTAGSGLTLSFPYNGGGAINLYTILFIIFFGVGYGAYYATADMPIPMVADCSDYETYRSGKYIPGIMGTLFSLVDKLVSSLAQTLVALIFLVCAGLAELPTDATEYSGGIKVAVIIMFCVIPLLAWAATLWAMHGYSLTGAKMKEIQAINAVRKDAVGQGMTLDAAMEKYQTIDQVPEQYKQGI
ncbi:MAG: MFS transporter [Clostridiales bacterium]|nr:MFS transporter [Clostridiales bacterium]MCD7754019.1 MFS transporter [Clostridiales bacterium]